MSTASEQSGSPLSILPCERCDFAVKPGRQRFKGKTFLEFDMEQDVKSRWLQPAYDKPRSKKAFFDRSRSQDFLQPASVMRALGKNGENPPDGFRSQWLESVCRLLRQFGSYL